MRSLKVYSLKQLPIYDKSRHHSATRLSFQQHTGEMIVDSFCYGTTSMAPPFILGKMMQLFLEQILLCVIFLEQIYLCVEHVFLQTGG